MRHSDSYIVTLDNDNFDHAELLHELKLITKLYSNQSDFQFRVQRVGRLGKNNPNADKYKNNVYRCYRKYSKIRVADASRFDIYVYIRDCFYNHEYKNQRDALKALVATLRDFATKSLSYKTL